MPELCAVCFCRCIRLGESPGVYHPGARPFVRRSEVCRDHFLPSHLRIRIFAKPGENAFNSNHSILCYARRGLFAPAYALFYCRIACFSRCAHMRSDQIQTALGASRRHLRSRAFSAGIVPYVARLSHEHVSDARHSRNGRLCGAHHQRHDIHVFRVSAAREPDPVTNRHAPVFGMRYQRSAVQRDIAVYHGHITGEAAVVAAKVDNPADTGSIAAAFIQD